VRDITPALVFCHAETKIISWGSEQWEMTLKELRSHPVGGQLVLEKDV
jgi:hypothetical protein